MKDKIHVLIVEDDLDQALSLKLTLEHRKEVEFTTETAQTVHSALTRLGRGGVDVVLLDLRLPDGLGSEVIEKIKHAAKVKVIALTGCSDMKEAAEKAGADAFIVKPAEPSNLSKEIQAQVVWHETEENKTRTMQILRQLGTALKLAVDPANPLPIFPTIEDDC